MTDVKYKIKVDDLLITMLKDYHEIEPSEVFSFFGARLKEASTKEINITDKSRKRDITMRRRNGSVGHGGKMMSHSAVRFSVLRGFYPNTKMPFKMVIVLSNTGVEPYAKIQLGVKDEFTFADSASIDRYDIASAEHALLDKPIDDEHKVKYVFKKFKCMRPKGMLLYKKAI